MLLKLAALSQLKIVVNQSEDFILLVRSRSTIITDKFATERQALYVERYVVTIGDIRSSNLKIIVNLSLFTNDTTFGTTLGCKKLQRFKKQRKSKIFYEI